jgi:hypothetical protein
MGLAIQALLRLSSLRHLPVVMVLLWTLVLTWRADGREEGWKGVVGYGGASLLLLILFWPEIVPFGRAPGRMTDPGQIASYAASQDPGAQVVTAQDTGQVPTTLSTPALVAPGFRLLLRAITETPLALAKAINSQAQRTFANVMPMSWLLGLQLTAPVTAAIQDWVQSCYAPVVTTILAQGQAQTQEDLLPWNSSAVAQALATRQVPPGASTGLVFISGPQAGNLVPCDVYLAAVEFQTQSWLYDLKSPAGTPLSQVFEQELGLDAQQQARFLVYREILRVLPAAVTAPSLAGAMAATTVTSLGAGGLSSGLLGKITGLFSFGLGVAKGATEAMSTQVQNFIGGLTWLVQVAVFLVWFGPYIMGLIQLVMLSLFPFVLLWALIPRTQFLPLAQYFVALLFTFAVPLFWALVDQAQKLAGAAAQPPTGGFLGIMGPLYAAGWSMMVTVLGILVIPVVCGLLFFAAFRAVGSLWRGGIS